MFQLRRILLSGLVALLMVGMVTAGGVATVDSGEAIPDGITIHTGVWDEHHTNCFEASAADCLKIGFSVDLTWLTNLFS